MEHKIIHSAILDRKAFNALEAQDALKDLSDQGGIVYKEIQNYYKLDNNTKSVDKDIIYERLKRKFPSEKHQTIFQSILESKENVSPPNVLAELRELRKQNIRDDIIAATNSGDNTDKLLELFDKFKQVVTQDEVSDRGTATLYHNVTVAEILEKASSKAKIKLSPEVLNEVTDGGALAGHHILIFARPDAGKTTLAIEMIHGFLKQGKRVLYVGNEDPAHDILYRILTRLVRMSKKEIEDNPQVAEGRKKHRNFSNLKVITMYPGTCPELEDAVEAHEPHVLIVDQARNITHKNQNRVEQLEIVERFIRNLGKKYNMLTVSFTQAGDSADNKLILSMGDVDFSNTGMQASADLMIGMGVNLDYERSGRRMLSFPKNKLSGDKQPRQVGFDAKYNRVY